MPKRATVSKSFRFTQEEWDRFQALLAVGRRRQYYAKEVDVLKELMGLIPLKALTEQDVQRFRNGGVETAGRKL